MRAVVLEMPEHWLEERRRLGHDLRDEVWDGVLHMVPQPTFWHQLLAIDLAVVLKPLANQRGWYATYETGLYGVAGEKNYRVPDLIVVDPAHVADRGVEQRAEVVVEILSPNDESREKLPFYAACGVQEVWLIDPKTRIIEVFSLTDQYSTAGAESAVLGIRFSVGPGPTLRLEWADGSSEI